MKTGMRMTPSRVHSWKATSQTSRGWTQRTGTRVRGGRAKGGSARSRGFSLRWSSARLLVSKPMPVWPM